ncbi:hypothetical protein [Desulfocurvus vexinensis]|uniref:hypothetical protein n=1 Tax=Desulfocurvus vexinensis TaxID=399548 RepID=UPI0012EB14E1|nr:hypothetical protein [Desulfocurvus vexinensis]
MPAVGGIGAQQAPQVAQVDHLDQPGGVQGPGEGLGGHQARVGNAPGRGIGQLLSAFAHGIADLARSFCNFIARIGSMITGRGAGPAQEVQPQEEEADLGPSPQEVIDGARSWRVDNNELIEGGTSPASFREGCIQCMSDDAGVQQFIAENLDNGDYSSANFTGVENHPSDPSKFIAKFGDKQLVFSDRGSNNHEFRGPLLREQLTGTQFANLRGLIEQNHLGPHDSLSLYMLTALTNVLRDQTQNMSAEQKHEVRDAVSQMEFAHGRTVGQIANLSFLD